MQQEQITITILTPEENHRLTQTADVEIFERVCAKKVALGKYDSADNWREITIEEAEAYQRAKSEAIEARANEHIPIA